MKAVEVGQIPHSRWTADAIAETVGWAESFAIDRAVTEPQRELLSAAFASLRHQIESCEFAAEQGPRISHHSFMCLS